MLIIWSGLGFLTPVIAIVVAGLTTWIGQQVLGGMGLGRYTGLAVAVGLLAAAAINWLVGRRLSAHPGRELMDRATGRPVLVRERHSLFFVRMEWWSFVMVAGAALALWSALVDPAALKPPNPAPPAVIPADLTGK